MKTMQLRDDKRPEVVTVSIFGRDYPLHSEESAEYTNRIAELVDRRMAEIASAMNLADPTRVAIMAAMDIADQLLLHRKRQGECSERTEDALQKLGRILDEAGEKENAKAENR